MRSFRLFPLAARIVAASCLSTAASLAAAGVLTPELERSMAARGTHADTAVIIRFSEPVDLQSLATTDRRARDNRLLLALQARTAQQRGAIDPLLATYATKRVLDLWIVNGVAATLPAHAVRKVAAAEGVASVGLDSYVQHGRPQRMPAPRGAAGLAARLPSVAAPETADGGGAVATPGWNLVAIQAPQMWALGHTGRGVVVATMDSGVDLAHPDLRRAWRGGANSWFDPHGEEAVPYDALGHGTQAMGIVLGSRGLGVAPDARWIAVRLYDSNGRARMSDIHRAFQWLMDPDGDPATVDAPDIVNASWTLAGRAPGACIDEFADDIRALRSSGIAVVFAAGNDGPSERTSNSPANNPAAISVGSVGSDLALARQSSRGPSSCDRAVFPRLVAPGSEIRTTDLSHGAVRSYATVFGSSLAAPHVAGVLALLAGAAPAASVAELEAALQRGAQDLGERGPDNRYGFGLVRALDAYNALGAARARTSEAMAVFAR